MYSITPGTSSKAKTETMMMSSSKITSVLTNLAREQGFIQAENQEKAMSETWRGGGRRECEAARTLRDVGNMIHLSYHSRHHTNVVMNLSKYDRCALRVSLS